MFDPQPDDVRPFHCGTQYMDWKVRNCETCARQSDPDEMLDEMPCDIERALVEACLSDGRIPLAIANRMHPRRDGYGWPCMEHDPPFSNVLPDGSATPQPARTQRPASDWPNLAR